MGRTIAAILWKDLKIELRTKEAFSASFVFAVLVLLIFNFTLDLSSDEAVRVGGAFLWIAVAFAGTLSLNRSFAVEREQNSMQALILAPVDPGGLYLGKFFANVIFLLTTQVVLVPLFAIFFNIDITHNIGTLVLVLFLGTVGFSSVGTLFSAIASQTRMREVMLPVLLLPITVPLLIAAVETTTFAFGGNDGASFWFKVLIVYDVVFVTSCFLIFEHVLQE